MKSFASDNYAGVLPEVMEALQRTNSDHARSYGADDITARTTTLMRDIFEVDCNVYFVFNGTGANILSLSSATLSYNSVICADTSHLYCDESSAPETFTGCRMVPVTADEQGKLTVEAVEEKLIRKGDVHFAQPAVLSATQSTEYGTVYHPHELENLSVLARRHGLYFHLDGARFFNAAASLDCSLAATANRTGVDILSLGGTKAGMMYGEAVVVFNSELKKHIAYRQKQAIQLASKTRYIAAQFEAMLSNELWRRTASHANNMAALLARSLTEFPEIRITRPVHANAIFAEIPRHWYEPLQQYFPFYIWKERTCEVRLMCSWDTQPEEITGLISALRLQQQPGFHLSKSSSDSLMV
ncbi:MAG: low specificity L-threonine aldolase [Chitinophagia bacterium]|nr:low specificity L-threonine aldolase [Chitinophagia bacterium]